MPKSRADCLQYLVCSYRFRARSRLSMGLWVPELVAQRPTSNVQRPVSLAAGSEFMHMTLVIDIISWLADWARNENEMRIKCWLGPEREREIPIPRSAGFSIVRNVHAALDKCANLYAAKGRGRRGSGSADRIR